MSVTSPVVREWIEEEKMTISSDTLTRSSECHFINVGTSEWKSHYFFMLQTYCALRWLLLIVVKVRVSPTTFSRRLSYCHMCCGVNCAVGYNSIITITNMSMSIKF